MNNNYYYMLHLFLLWVCSLVFTDLYANTSQINRHVMHYGTQLNWYDEYDEYFIRYTGFKKSDPNQDPISNIRIINGASDTIFINKQIGGSLQKDIYWSNMEGYQMELLDETTLNRYKWYNPNKKLWFIENEISEGDYRRGRGYNTDKSCFYKIGNNEDYSSDGFMVKVCFFFLFLVSLFLIFPYWKCEKERIWYFFFGLSVVLAFCLVFFIERYTLQQLTLPLLIIVSTSVLLKIPKYNGIIRNIFQFVIGVLVISFFVHKQFFSLKEELRLVDGTRLDIRWQRGTCLVKRFYVRKMLKHLLPISVSTEYLDGKKYVVYVSKFEVSESDVAVINDELFSWFSAFFDRPLYGFSYRESRVFLDILNKVTGIKFDFLSYSEWNSASKGKRHTPNNSDYTNVDEGLLNEDGLQNLTGNLPEYTSSYFVLSPRLSLDADTVVQSYNYVFVAGSAYNCNDSLSVSFVNKNFREGSVGFRIIYRPNDIAARKFSILGRLRSDREFTKLPKLIELISIDELNIKDIDDYETFEEIVIESRFKSKYIKIKDLESKDTLTYFHPKGIEYYDFIPTFTFNMP